ncbi:MAG: cytochrome c [Acidobacteriota bacterium]
MKNRMAVAILSLMTFSAITLVAQEPGADTYKAKCAMCHAADGSGNTPAGKATKTPSFSSPEMLKMSTAQLIAGTKEGKGKMPGYSNKLTTGQITAVVAYIQTLQKK